MVDQPTAEALTEPLDGLIKAGAFDGLDPGTAFAELSHSRLGGTADTGLTETILEQLRAGGLARPTEDGVSVPLHPAVRTLVLVALPQLLRAPAEAAGFSLQPASNHLRAVRALVDTLDSQALPTAGHVVSFDLEQVALDLASIPLDEVLDFRDQHATEYRAYARELRRFLHGGNVGLAALVTERGTDYVRNKLSCALLEFWSMRTADQHVLNREAYWKQVLVSRSLDLNRN